MVTRSVHTTQDTSYWKVVGLVAVGGTVIFFWPFLAVVCFACVMAALFYPIFRRISRKVPMGLAAGLTVAISLLAVIIPVAFVLGVAVVQGVNLASYLGQTFNINTTGTLSENVATVTTQVNSVLAAISGGQLSLDATSITSFFSNTIPEFLRSATTFLVSVLLSIPSIITFVVIYAVTFMAVTRNGQNLVAKLHIISPFPRRITEIYLERTMGMIKASVVGQLILSTILAILTALLMLLIGAGPYFFLLVIIMTLLNMVPLGSSIIVYPAAVVAMLMGNVAGGIWVILIYSFVICNIENFMRVRLIPKNVRLPNVLMVLSVFCGVYYFGILGVVYGPVVMILLTTTFDAYLEYKGGTHLKSKQA